MEGLCPKWSRLKRIVVVGAEGAAGIGCMVAGGETTLKKSVTDLWLGGAGLAEVHSSRWAFSNPESLAGIAPDISDPQTP